jgi:hypothetical protein
MAMTFMFSLVDAYSRRNYFKQKYLDKALARLYEDEENAHLKATLKEAEDERNKAGRFLIEAERQRDSVLGMIEEMAGRAKEHVRARLGIYLGNPDKTTYITEAGDEMRAQMQKPADKEDGQSMTLSADAEAV